MSMLSWITAQPSAWLMIPLSGVGIYLAMIVLTRVAGLRSFSKLSSTDFATTVAIGSVIASMLLKPQPSLLAGALALTTLYGIQALVTWGRRHAHWVTRAIDNEPLLLMARKKVVHSHLKGLASPSTTCMPSCALRVLRTLTRSLRWSWKPPEACPCSRCRKALIRRCSRMCVAPLCCSPRAMT